MPFQFPSNGKAYPKDLCLQYLGGGKDVSIPFKREGVSKVAQMLMKRMGLPAFQFPSNGKAYPKVVRHATPSILVHVSIPFKREGVSKVKLSNTTTGNVFLICMFQFPSNGKAYPKRKQEIQNRKWYVSIPFKREGVSKDNTESRDTGRGQGVSIPFKREGVSKVYRGR